MKPATNCRGNSIVGILIAIAIIAGVMLVFAQGLVELRSYQNYKSWRISAESLKSDFVTLLTDANSWTKTFLATENSATLGCAGTTCNSGADFVIKDASGSTYFNTATIQNGFSKSGTTCQFVLGVPNNDCPFSVQLTWTKINSAMIRVTANLVIQVADPVLIRPWQINLIKAIE